MNHPHSHRSLFAAISLIFLLAPHTPLRAAAPDLTTTDLGTIDRLWTYNLGPTGMRGWIYHAWSVTAEQDGTTAFAPYQILVTSVAAGTPAAAVNLATDDVILGASAGSGAVPLFTGDARKSLGWAIGAAEAGNGILSLKRWRAGVTGDVSITLPVMGAYSETAPYDCAKSARILNNAANSLQQKILAKGWGGDSGAGAISALALLSTGKTYYDNQGRDMVQSYARLLAPPTLDLERNGIGAWDCYNSIFLAEYYMLTNDAAVFHGLSEYVIYAAKHSSMFGTAGHGFSNIPPPGGWEAGGTHGSMSWYGPVNQAGLAAQLSIVLGKKAGVVDPEIEPAIARAANFFGYYVNRGSIPYGEHQPYYGEHQLQGMSRTYYDHCSNGKDALCAVMFGLMGDKPVPTEYFSRMCVAGFRGEQYGHTGQGFSYLWTMLGANVGGPTAVAEYQKKLRWDRDMKRRCDGSFVYEGGEQWGPGQGSDYWDDSYTYWGYPTAYYLLHASIPLKKLHITGKDANPANELSAPTVGNAIWASDFTSLCGGYTKETLVAALGEWDPIVRFNAATELATRTLTPTEVGALIVMAENPDNANQREAACTALGCLKAADAVPALIRRLRDTDIWVRAKAAKALGQVNAASVASSVPDMLDAFVTNVASTYPFEAGFNWNDPLQIANGYLAETLFENLGGYTISANKTLLYPAVRAGIKQPAGMWRGKLDAFVQNRLTLADVEVLIQDLLEDARTEGPCDRMFTVTPPAAAMNALAKYHIQEGIQACFDNVAYWGGVLGATAINRLADYGEAARWTLPDLYADLAWWKHDNNYDTLVNTVAALEAATTTPALVYAMPVADPQILAIPANTPRAFTLTGFSCRTNPVSYTVATRPAYGSLTGTPPNLTYIPWVNYQGMDSFTFRVTDSMTTSAPATVHLVVGSGGTGLTGLYYDNVDLTSLGETRTNQTVNFDWGVTPPAPTLGTGSYSVRWSGQVQAPETGTYRFSTRTSDGVRLWINGVQVINDWNDQASNLWNDSAAISLTAGQKYNLKMEYYDNSNPATVRLYWYIPSRQSAMIIPPELLSPVPGVILTSPLDGAHFGLRAGQSTTVTLTADVADVAGTVTNVSFYHGDTLIGSDATVPYSVVWTNVAAGEYLLTARATDNTEHVSTSPVAVITVDGYTVPVTTGLACHFDASVGVTTDADGVVQSWNDRSGNAHHATLGSGSPVIATNQLMSLPAVQFRGNATWFNLAGGFFTKEQYVVVRSPNATWNGSGTFLGRKSDDFLTVRTSSYNMANGTDGFWQDHYPAAVSRNGIPIAQNSQDGSAFHLAPITDYMLLKITVDGQASAANLAAYPYYQIGRNETLGTMDFDVAEIIGYTNALSANDEALVGGYLTAKYGITTAYPATGSIANRPATGVTHSAAAINATLMCNGNNYDVVAYWGAVNGGMNPANWANSAAIGSWSQAASSNLSRTLTNLAPGTTHYFNFRATNATQTIWASAPLSFTTISTAGDFLIFGANVAGSSATIDTVAGTVAWTVPHGTDLTNLAPIYTVSPLASGSPPSAGGRNFSTPQTYTITAQDGSTKSYTVTAIEGAASADCDILTFGPGAVINGTHIALTVPYGTNLAALAPTYTVSTGATGIPASGVAPAPNFATASPATYTMSALNGATSKTYYVTITVLPFNAPGVSNTTIAGDWSFLNSQNPGPWTRARTTTLTANGIQIGTAGVGEGMIYIAKPAALSFINSGVEMVFTGSNAVGNNAGYAYISMYRDSGNPPRNAYGITATNFTTSGGRLTTSVNNAASGGGEIISSTPLVNANFVGRHTMALVRFDDNTLKAYLDGVEIGSRTSTAPSLTLGFIGIGANYFGGATYLPQGTVVERVRAFTFPSGGFSPNDLLVLPAAIASSAAKSSVVASPAIVANNGLATSTICVTLKDASGNPLAGKSVTLVSSRGAADTLSPPTVTSNTSGVASFTVKSPTAGSSVFTATDTTAGVTLTQTATVTFSAMLLPTITLARHSDTDISSTFGDLLRFDVTVTGGSGTPVGGITLKDGGSNGTTVGSAYLTNGACVITTPALAVGAHSNIVAVYGGNNTYATGTSNPLSTQTVSLAAPDGLTAACGSPGSIVLTWNAAVGATGYKVSIRNTATQVEQFVTTTASPYTAVGLTNGISHQFKVLGTHSIGDSPYTAVVSGTPFISPSTHSLASSQGGAATYGTAVTFTSTVAVTGGLAIGAVDFMDGATVLGSGTLHAGQASFTTGTLAAGVHAITASYPGDAWFAASTASAIGYTVNAKPLAITGVTASNKVYDGTTSAVLTGGAPSGVIAGDSVTVVAGTGSFADANVGTGKSVTAGAYALGGAHAGNYIPIQPSGLTADISALPIQLTGTRVYDGTVAAGALTISNNHDSGNLSLTGAAFLAGKDAGAQPVITRTAAPAWVRNANGNTGASAAATISVTMSGAPAPGNMMIAVIATRGTTGGGNIVSSITQSGVPNGTWTRAAEAHNTSMTSEIWYAPNLPAGAGTAVTINQTPFLSSAVVMEYAGILAAVPLDQIAPGNATGTSQAAVTGTTSATTQARELWIGAIGYAYNSTRTLGTILNSFTSVDNAVTGNTTAGSNARVYALQRIASATGTASSGGTISNATQWAGTIATFKANTSTLALSGSAAANYTLSGVTGSVRITPKALTVTGLAAGGKAYDGSVTADLTGAAALLAAEAAGAGTTSDGKPYTADTLMLGGTAAGTFADRNVGSSKPVTVTGLTLTGAGCDNYTFTQPAVLTAGISARALAITALNQSKTYGQSVVFGSDDTRFTSGGLQNGETIGSVTLACAGGDAAAAVAGSPYAITPGAATGGTFTADNYTISYVPGTLTVNPAEQTITFGALADKTCGDAPFALTATTDSGLSVGYASTDPSVASVSDNTVTILKAGNTTLTASQAGDTNHYAAAPVAQALTVHMANYDRWASDPAQGLTDGVNNGPADDPDHDGIPNLLEFSLGGDPMVSSPAILPVLTHTGGCWTLEYERGVLSRPPATTQAVEYGDDLSGWIQIPIPPLTHSDVTITPGSLTDHVRVTLPDQGNKGFVRLKVTQ